MTEPVSSALYKVFVNFTKDITANRGNAESVLDQINAFFQNPPTDIETLGFYGAEDFSADERTLRSSLNLFEKESIVFGFEDKYIFEMLNVFEDQALIPGGSADAINKRFLGALYALWTGEETDEVQGSAYVAHCKKLMQNLPEYWRDVQKAFAEKGVKLLQFQVPLGDTLLYCPVPISIVENWAGTTLYTTDEDDKFAIIEPSLGEYWSFLHYAFQMPDEIPFSYAAGN